MACAADSIVNYALPAKTAFPAAMPRYPNAWFYIDASLAPSFEGTFETKPPTADRAANRTASIRARASERLRQLIRRRRNICRWSNVHRAGARMECRTL
jgi:hypothetical protein